MPMVRRDQVQQQLGVAGPRLVAPGEVRRDERGRPCFMPGAGREPAADPRLAPAGPVFAGEPGLGQRLDGDHRLVAVAAVQHRLEAFLDLAEVVPAGRGGHGGGQLGVQTQGAGDLGRAFPYAGVVLMEGDSPGADRAGAGILVVTLGRLGETDRRWPPG